MLGVVINGLLVVTERSRFDIHLGHFSSR